MSPIRTKSDNGKDPIRISFSSEKQLVLKLTFALKRTSVHNFNSNFLVVKSSAINGTETALTEAVGGGEGIGGGADGGVGEFVWWFGIGRDGAFARCEFAEAEG